MLSLRVWDFCLEEAKQLMAYAVEVLESTPADMRKPAINGVSLFDQVDVPKNIVDIFTAKQIELVNEDHGICFDFQYEFGMLAYDAWLHRNDPIEDVFALRIHLDTGIKVFTVVNTHPALDQMLRWNADAMKEHYLERLESKEPQHYDRVCKEIAAMIAEYCVGEDYTFFLDNDFQKLPKRLRDACMSDAKKLVDGLITSGT